MAIMAKPARPHPILGEALARNKTTTWSGLIYAETNSTAQYSFGTSDIIL
jgi:hypothetical protein